MAQGSTASDVPLRSALVLESLGPRGHLIDPDARCEGGNSFTPIYCFFGRTENLDCVDCHYSVLMPGSSPHPPHTHREEEILVVVNGSAELVVESPTHRGVIEILPAPAGTAIYYPSFQRHTIRNASDAPVIYAMIRWASTPAASDRRLSPCLVEAGWLGADDARGRISMAPLLQGPTDFLAKLHAHTTVIQPGGGYEAHSDTHDVAIFLLQGEISILGRRLGAPAVGFLPAGHLHDMANTGAGPAKYLVWEFHKTAEPHAAMTPLQGSTEPRIAAPRW